VRSRTHYGSRTIHIPTDDEAADEAAEEAADEAADEAAEAETASGAAEPTDPSPSSSSSIIRLRLRGAADGEGDASDEAADDVFADNAVAAVVCGGAAGRDEAMRTASGMSSSSIIIEVGFDDGGVCVVAADERTADCRTERSVATEVADDDDEADAAALPDGGDAGLTENGVFESSSDESLSDSEADDSDESSESHSDSSISPSGSESCCDDGFGCVGFADRRTRFFFCFESEAESDSESQSSFEGVATGVDLMGFFFGAPTRLIR